MMEPSGPNEPESMDQIISQRSGVGPNELIAGWQSVLSRMLDQMHPFLKPARIITFRRLSPYEQKVFQQIVQQVNVSEAAWGVYLPPSVRNQMIYTNQGLRIPAEETVPRDDGVLLFSRPVSHKTIVNGLLAHPPFAPAVDVYNRGALLAGYVYDGIDQCLADLTAVIQTHLP
ncbi:MAG: hypothetical protein KJO34_00895 [Deltaproteobacteria bacterium]|nr:hypothetical protein [Deltaproteobacteria bacterium]